MAFQLFALANGISRVEEDEEEIDAALAKECVDSPSKLSVLGSRVLKRVKEEYGFTDFLGFVYLGGFENIECETEEPERAKTMIEEFLTVNKIEFKDSDMTKFAVSRSGKLP
ncbi:unnamed protein product [Thlaspi arvense]|uniref:Uncharacterized protein n=1 Tax=Thlaspi arvense TaxID=13288 RepID=A0AAU9RYI3_THLAR|nr:unnamed protein product [Thlaspi arvense]